MSSKPEGLGIRQASIADTDRIREIARLAYNKYVPRIGREPAPMVADFDAHTSRGEINVATRAKAILGYIVGFPRANDFFIENIGVDPNAAGDGVGKALMVHAEATAIALDHNLVRLYTNIQMHENFPFYAALGYHKTHEVTEAGFHRIYFEKILERS